MLPTPLRRVLLGAAAGYAGSLAMDAVTTAFMQRQSDSSRRRERQLQPEGAPTAMARKLADVLGRRVDDEGARRLGKLLHRASGVAGGSLMALIAARRKPLPASLATALAFFVVIDEGATLVSGAAPPPHRYPLATHVRGLVGHLAFGASVGVLLQVTRSALDS